MTAAAAVLNDYVRKPDLRVLAVIVGLGGYLGRLWFPVSQAKQLQLLRDRYGLKMSRRHLNRQLGALARDGYVRRIRRHKRGPGGRIDMHATVYAIRLRAQRVFNNLVPYFRRRMSAGRPAGEAAAVHNFPSLAVTNPAQCGTPVSTLLAGAPLKSGGPPG